MFEINCWNYRKKMSSGILAQEKVVYSQYWFFLQSIALPSSSSSSILCFLLFSLLFSCNNTIHQKKDAWYFLPSSNQTKVSSLVSKKLDILAVKFLFPPFSCLFFYRKGKNFKSFSRKYKTAKTFLQNLSNF